ncbi:MAG: serine protease, partial [Leptotrichiaceae bacterium]
MKKLIILVYIIVFGMMYGADDTIKKSLVKIYSSHQQFDFQSPWQSGLDYNSTATGFVVDGNRILTNAHAVVNNKFLQIRKDGDSKKYKAKVKFISEEYDLAILEVEDKAFFNNTVPLKFGKLPNLRDKVTIYGYPLGGDKLSTTQGIVSRIEHNSYTLTNQRFLIGQTDAAINPGNSGGPVITNDKVIGVAFSGLMLADNIG